VSEPRKVSAWVKAGFWALALHQGASASKMDKSSCRMCRPGLALSTGWSREWEPW
jgi:hypothetical protein